jgi:hypothetical protein
MCVNSEDPNKFFKENRVRLQTRCICVDVENPVNFKIIRGSFVIKSNVFFACISGVSQRVKKVRLDFSSLLWKYFVRNQSDTARSRVDILVHCFEIRRIFNLEVIAISTKKNR